MGKQYRYSVEMDTPEIAENFLSDSDPDDICGLCEDAAYDFYNSSPGNEEDWPTDFYIYADDEARTLLGVSTVRVEHEVSFYADPIESEEAQHGQSS